MFQGSTSISAVDSLRYHKSAVPAHEKLRGIWGLGEWMGNRKENGMENRTGEERLITFFHNYPKVAIAFSGGVDSAYLLYAALKYGKEVRAYYIKSEFQPQFELEDALRLAEECGMTICGDDTEKGVEHGENGETRLAILRVMHLNALSQPRVRENPENRCYFCKQGIFGAIRKAVREDGYEVLLDGTNASDDAADRPGMKALQELSVLSPLRECGLTKDEIRRLSKEAGLFTWNKPAYACLATRIPSGEEITEEKLRKVEEAESFLFSLGFLDFRVRTDQGHARIQLREDQWELLSQNRKEVLNELKKSFKTVSLDLAVR